MITTVFANSPEEKDLWRDELLEASWRLASQPGALVRLDTARRGLPKRPSHQARPVTMLPFSPHPYTGDVSSEYLLPAGLLEWLYREPTQGTVLVLETSSLFCAALDEETTPGKVIATPWPDLPRPGTGPFGLGDDLVYLERVCVDPALEVPAVTLPALVHAEDLLRLAPRWLELTMLLREACREWSGWSDSTQRLAFAIALAEWKLEVDERPLAVGTRESSDEEVESPILKVDGAILGEDGQTVWDPASWQPWTAVDPSVAAPGPGREVLLRITDKIAFDAAGGELSLVRPKRCAGIREARVLDQMVLDVPGQEGTVSLNVSSVAIWELVDDARSIAEIAHELERRFGKARGALGSDVETAVEQLRDVGVLELVPVER